MRYVKTAELKPDMVIGKTVYDVAGTTLISAGTVLTDNKIRQLVINGVSSVCVDDEFTSDIEIEETVSSNLENKIVQDLNNMDISAVINDAYKLIYEFETSKEFVYNPYKWINQKDEQYHAVFVAELVIMFALSLRTNDGKHMSSGALQELVLASLLHNIGYLARNHEVMDKLEDIGSKVYDEKKVPEYSYQIVSNDEKTSINSNTKTAIRFQNKNADGSDLEEEFKKVGVSVGAKILKIVKTYEKLITTPVSGNEPLSPTEALEKLKQQAGTLFDENIFNCFSLFVPVYPKGVTVRLNDGRVGVVSKTVLSNDMNNQRLLISIRLTNGQNINISSKHSVKIEDFSILPSDILEKKSERKVS